MRKVNSLLADSSEIYREGLAKLLQLEPTINVVSTCSTALEAIEAARVQRPDVVLVDIEFPEGNNITVISHIHEVAPDTRIIILTNSKSSIDFFSTIKAGATGYLLKDGDFKNLVRAISLAAEGKLVIDPPIATLVLEALQSLDRYRHRAKLEGINLLSQHEKAVLVLMARAATNKEIASTLFISENTAKVHVHNIMQKLQAHNRLEATICAIETGLLHSQDGTGDQQT